MLVDTQLLLWAGAASERLSPRAQRVFDAIENDLLFSVASIWEVAIKSSLGRADFTVDPGSFRTAMLGADYLELPILGTHAAEVADLPAVHPDPFDRILIAQARVEGVPFITADTRLSDYGHPVQIV